MALPTIKSPNDPEDKDIFKCPDGHTAPYKDVKTSIGAMCPKCRKPMYNTEMERQADSELYKHLPRVNVERLKDKKNLTNTEIACLLLGWQGGTIHQVMEETGLTMDQILKAPDIETLIIEQMAKRKKLASLTGQLDCIASELELIDPRISLALDKIADELENSFSDNSLKSKLNSISRKYNGRYSDTGWNEITKMVKEFHAVLPNITLVEAVYDHDEKHNPSGKKWTYVGAFKNKETSRALWIQITAAGVGSVKDPLEKYELTTVIEALSPKNLKDKAKEAYESLVG